MVNHPQRHHEAPASRAMWIVAGLIASILGGVAVWAVFFRGEQDGPLDPSSKVKDQTRSPIETPAELRPVRHTNPGYLGAAVCGECHAERLRDFRGTRHFIACCAPEGELTPSGFAASTPSPNQDRPSPNESTLSAPHWPFGFRPEQTEEGYFEHVEGETPTQAIDQRHRIDMVYGAQGKADEVYFTWIENRLFELPFAWLHPWKQWGKQIYADVGDDVLRPTTPRCLECHTTYFERLPNDDTRLPKADNAYVRDSILPGVTCERCHGPGREHVEHHRANSGLKKGVAIVHPGQLARDRQLDVCSQCHSPALHHRSELFSFRPGDELNAHFRSLTIEGVENDHVAHQERYLRRSKCFEQSDALTCVTCHDPHHATDAVQVAAACAKCHQGADCGSRESLPTAVRDRCVDCHMPTYNRSAVKFRSAAAQYIFPMRPHEHRIAIYPRAQQATLLEWHRSQDTPSDRAQAAELAQQLVASWAQEGDELRSAYRFIAAIGAYREALGIAADEAVEQKVAELVELQGKLDQGRIAAEYQIAQARTRDAIQALEELLKISPAQASVHGRLGTLYETVGQHSRALEHWAAVNKYDPDDPYAHNIRGWTAYVAGRPTEAIEAFAKADELLPSNSEIHYRWALAYLSAGNGAEAEKRLRVALRVNPKHVGAMQAMSHALREQHRVEEAVGFAYEAARRSEFANFDMQISLIDACREAGRDEDAREALAQAKRLALNADMRKALEERER